MAPFSLDLPDDFDETLADEDTEEHKKERKPTLAAAMGLLEMKRAREEILMMKWEEFVETSNLRERPLYALEQLIGLGIKHYGSA